MKEDATIVVRDAMESDLFMICVIGSLVAVSSANKPKSHLFV